MQPAPVEETATTIKSGKTNSDARVEQSQGLQPAPVEEKAKTIHGSKSNGCARNGCSPQ